MAELRDVSLIPRTRGNGVNLYHTTPPGTLSQHEDPYSGLDRFGRVVRHTWGKVQGSGWVSTFATLDAYAYGHDAGGSRLYKQNLVNPAFSELYHSGDGYDDLGRLTHFARGTLSAAKDGIAGTASRQQSWDLDPLGNWQSVTTDGTAETRDHDGQNRVTTINPADPDSTALTYSANGEMRSDATGHTYTYDAWGRLTFITPPPVFEVVDFDAPTGGAGGRGSRPRSVRGMPTTRWAGGSSATPRER